MSSNLMQVILRGNPNINEKAVAKTVIAIYGGDFFKKFPLLKEAGVLRRLISRLVSGEHCSVIMSDTALARLREANTKLHSKGIAPVVEVGGARDLGDYNRIKSVYLMCREGWGGNNTTAFWLIATSSDGDHRFNNDFLDGEVIIHEHLGTIRDGDKKIKAADFLVKEISFSTVLRRYAVFEALFEEFGDALVTDIDYEENGEHVDRDTYIIKILRTEHHKGKASYVATPLEDLM